MSDRTGPNQSSGSGSTGQAPQAPAYWSTKSRLNAFDKDHFVNQVATMSQICGELMCADMSELKSAESNQA